MKNCFESALLQLMFYFLLLHVLLSSKSLACSLSNTSSLILNFVLRVGKDVISVSTLEIFPPCDSYADDTLIFLIQYSSGQRTNSFLVAGQYLTQYLDLQRIM